MIFFLLKFINISDHVKGTTMCTQASAPYSLPGKLLNDTLWFNIHVHKKTLTLRKKRVFHVHIHVHVIHGAFLSYGKTKQMRGPSSRSVAWCQHVLFSYWNKVVKNDAFKWERFKFVFFPPGHCNFTYRIKCKYIIS